MPDNKNASLTLEQRITNLKRLLFNKYYDNLNDRQRESVFTVKGNLLVLAGAGSGKTTALVNRISHILSFGDAYYSEELPNMSEREVTMFESVINSGRPVKKEALLSVLMQFRCDVPYPDNILSITFTNKAANEMKTRLKAVLGDSADRIWAGTFHSICVRILRRYIESLGYPSSFTIYDTDDVKKLVTECMKEMELDEKSFPVKTLMNVISRAKNKLITPDKFPVGGDFRELKYQELYTMYQKRLFDSGAVDFDDIIMLTVRLLKENEEAREFCTTKFKYVLVDEYQDTNRAQYELLRIITGKNGNLMVVGDDDQSIYRFRGAVVENILRFEKDFPGTKVVLLEQNYRSTKNIINAANSVIKNNTGRHNKALWCDAEEGEKLECLLCANQDDEAQKIINIIQTNVSTGKNKLSDFAVLYRMNAQSSVLETAFSKAGVPHRLLGGIRFFSRAEVKDIISYLCLINNPADDLRLLRILNVPKRGIGDKAVETLRHFAEENDICLFEAIKRASYGDSKKNKALASFASVIEKLRDIKDNGTLPQLVERTIYETGYFEMLTALGPEGEDRIKNINELISGAASYADSHDEPTLSGYLEEVALVADIDNYDAAAEAVTLMTIHSAKGLEFNHVFLPGAEEGVFPSTRSDAPDDELEEERRLFYVAVTRARKNLTILHTKQRMLYGRTQFNPLSQFVEEIPDEYLKAPKNANERRPGGYFDDEFGEANDMNNGYIPATRGGGYYGGSYRDRGEDRRDYSWAGRDRDEFSDNGYRKDRYRGGNDTGYGNSSDRYSTGYERSYGSYEELSYPSSPRSASVSPSRPASKPATPKPAAPKAPSKPSFKAGDKVLHKIFGQGKVLKATPMGNDVLYEVEFADGNVKKLMGNYANMTAQNS
ncbi:MAG: ATP-dependent DNA helicase PcrA [Ruminococcaceae bacterium]|nr:ATP-dependent DNA helicase PcrA [Oscillospiraceae bacterium]